MGNNTSEPQDPSKVTDIMADAIPGIVIGAAIGGVSLGIYSGVKGMKPNAICQRLTFKPEAFQLDIETARLFQMLEPYRIYSPDDYDQAGDNADSLFLLRISLLKQESKPCAENNSTATSYTLQARDRLNSLYEIAYRQLVLQQRDKLDNLDLYQNSKQVHDIKKQEQIGINKTKEIKDIINKIVSRLERHVSIVLASCPYGVGAQSNEDEVKKTPTVAPPEKIPGWN
jgi:hypothetical protein